MRLIDPTQSTCHIHCSSADIDATIVGAVQTSMHGARDITLALSCRLQYLNHWSAHGKSGSYRVLIVIASTRDHKLLHNYSRAGCLDLIKSPI